MSAHRCIVPATVVERAFAQTSLQMQATLRSALQGRLSETTQHMTPLTILENIIRKFQRLGRTPLGKERTEQFAARSAPRPKETPMRQGSPRRRDVGPRASARAEIADCPGQARRRCLLRRPMQI
ncbi:unnamed protein product [Prorocentrum cordatum]|uniref:Uncharacterized protein n=1 Tax=Prorocentrum cordatum TaxID=2364126 RepID=A0ABN9W045_9DINO|nr:unnamed protein product [Polarella glacialis]